MTNTKRFQVYILRKYAFLLFILTAYYAILILIFRYRVSIIGLFIFYFIGSLVHDYRMWRKIGHEKFFVMDNNDYFYNYWGAVHTNNMFCYKAKDSLILFCLIIVLNIVVIIIIHRVIVDFFYISGIIFLGDYIYKVFEWNKNETRYKKIKAVSE